MAKIVCTPTGNHRNHSLSLFNPNNRIKVLDIGASDDNLVRCAVTSNEEIFDLELEEAVSVEPANNNHERDAFDEEASGFSLDDEQVSSASRSSPESMSWGLSRYNDLWSFPKTSTTKGYSAGGLHDLLYNLSPDSEHKHRSKFCTFIKNNKPAGEALQRFLKKPFDQKLFEKFIDLMVREGDKDYVTLFETSIAMEENKKAFLLAAVKGEEEIRAAIEVATTSVSAVSPRTNYNSSAPISFCR